MQTSELVAWAGLGLSVLLALILIWLWLRLRAIERRYTGLMAGAEMAAGAGGGTAPSLGEVITGQGPQLDKAVGHIAAPEKALQSIGITLQASVQ